VLCVHNLSRHPQPVQLNLSRQFNGSVPVELTGGTAFPNIGLRPYLLTLPGYGSYWFSIVTARQGMRKVRRAPDAAAPPIHHSLPDGVRVSPASMVVNGAAAPTAVGVTAAGVTAAPLGAQAHGEPAHGEPALARGISEPAPVMSG
jgi:hypothetical protein